MVQTLTDQPRSVTCQPDGLLVDGRRFSFNEVREGDDNGALFSAVGTELVASTLGGYNGTLMAYGATGSGKTYSVTGASGQVDGLAQRLVRDLLGRTTADAPHAAYSIQMQFVQVYLERIYDLLATPREDTIAPGRGKQSGKAWRLAATGGFGAGGEQRRTQPSLQLRGVLPRAAEPRRPAGSLRLPAAPPPRATQSPDRAAHG